MLKQLKWLHNINLVMYRLFSVLLLQKSAFCQKWALRRRRSIRQNCHIYVEILYNDKRFSGIILNISAHGAYLEIQHQLEPGQKINLCFPLHYADPPVETSATIMWTGTGALGIQFIP